VRSAHTLSVAGVVKCRFPLPRAASAEREQLSALSISVPVSTQPTPGRDDPSLHVSFPFSRRKAQAGCTPSPPLRPNIFTKAALPRAWQRILRVDHSADRSGLNSQSSVLKLYSDCNMNRFGMYILLWRSCALCIGTGISFRKTGNNGNN
jgi:hypothetical protein